MLGKLLAIIICAQVWTFAKGVPAKAESVRIPQGTSQDQSGIATLPVLALDRDGRPVTDLSQNELELYEGKQRQSIELFSRSPGAPLEIGFLIDISTSDAGSLRAFRFPDDTGLAGEVLHGGDLAFVVTFSKSGSLVCPLTSDVREVDKALRGAFRAKVPRDGTSSIYDAIYWACNQGAEAHSGHKGLVILSDMQDNSSYHTREEVTALARRTGTLIYPIIVDETSSRGQLVAKAFARQTGGVPFNATKFEALRETFRNIRADLDNTYIIQYRPSSQRPATIKIRCTRKGTKIIVPDRRP